MAINAYRKSPADRKVQNVIHLRETSYRDKKFLTVCSYCSLVSIIS